MGKGRLWCTTRVSSRTLIYINDLTDDLESCPFIFADDTTLFEVVDNPINSAQLLNKDLNKFPSGLISGW
jgi:hypothetical protein